MDWSWLVLRRGKREDQKARKKERDQSRKTKAGWLAIKGQGIGH